MRAGFFSIAALLMQKFADCQQHRHGHPHKKRDIAVVTNIKYMTVETDGIEVYVNAHGEPWTTKVIHHDIGDTAHNQASLPPASQQTRDIDPMASASPFASYGALQQYIPTTHFEKSKVQLTQPLLNLPTLTSNTTAEALVAEASPTSPPGLSPSSSEPHFSHGISYSPYNANGTCKSASQVARDLEMVAEYSVIRLYGTDCDQISTVLKAIIGRGISLFIGIFDLTQLSGECKEIVDAAKGDWGIIKIVSVGNELVNNGKASVAEVTAAIEQVRSILKASGYNGPVVTVDTMTAMKANPELCQASDFCAINCHAFFDGNVDAEGAGHFVRDWAQKVSEATGGKSVVIAETGWPTQGNKNNKAIPSQENHEIAITSIRQLIPENLILYSAFNDLWKEDSDNTHDAEKFWGILGNAPS